MPFLLVSSVVWFFCSMIFPKIITFCSYWFFTYTFRMPRMNLKIFGSFFFFFLQVHSHVILLSSNIYTPKRFKKARGRECRHRLIAYSLLLMSASLNYLFLLYDWGGRNMEDFANGCNSTVLIKHSGSGGLVWNGCFLLVWKKGQWVTLKTNIKNQTKNEALFSVLFVYFLIIVFNECLTVQLWLYCGCAM